MKKEQRKIYLELASELDWDICAFCKFNVALGGESPCDCGEPSCEHPLKYQLEDQCGSYGLTPGDDCWGFRPSKSIDFCADIVGVCLAKGWESASWWQSKKGQWKVAKVEV